MGSTSTRTIIESTGTQYIDTGISGSANLKVETDFQLANTTDSGTIFGNYTSSNLLVSGYSNGGKFSYPGNRRPVNITINTPDLNRHTIIFNNGDNKYYFDGAEVTAAGTAAYFYSNANIFLFNYYGALSVSISAKIYSFKITDTSTDTVLINMVPVLDGNGVPCMWDTVSQTFFYNQGTGDFLYG